MEDVKNHLLIGLGGTGGKILKAFRKRLFSEFAENERTKLPIGFVYVDSSAEMMNPADKSFRVLGQDASFDKNSFVNIKSVNLETIYSNLDAFPHLKGIVGRPDVMKKTIGPVGSEGAAEQKRRLGRILFASSIQTYLNTLSQQYAACKVKSGGDSLQIHIFTGLAGGTGSGSIVDVMVQTRKHYPEANIVVYAMLPERDISSRIDSGRYHENAFAALKEINAIQAFQYKPYDITSNRGDRIELPGNLRSVVNGVILYSNTNENGAVIDSFTQLPELVASFAYYRIFLTYNEHTTHEYIRSYSFENITDFDAECDDRKKERSSEMVRSKRFSSFGIKRIIYPEKKNLDNISYTIGEQSLYQLRYNNWIDGAGFVNDIPQRDYNSYVSDSVQLENWRLTDKHLTLNVPILESDKDAWGETRTYWDNVIGALSEEAKGKEQPLHELAAYCAERYEKNYRKIGVEKFYETKTKALKEHAIEIKRFVENYLFDKWASGELSIYDLIKISDLLIEQVSGKKTEYEARLKSESEKLEQLTRFKEGNEVAWANLGLMDRALGKGKRLFGEQITVLRNLYIKKTEWRGIYFGIDLLTRLRAELEQLKADVTGFFSIISEAIKETESKITATKIVAKDIRNATDPLVEINEDDKVTAFKKEIIYEKRHMEGVNSEIRKAFLEKVGTLPTFGKVVDSVTKDDIIDVFETITRSKIKKLHDEICVRPSEKVIGLNVLEQLEKQLNSEDALRSFARDIVEKSGVYMKSDQAEIISTVPNNDTSLPGTNIARKIVLVTLPLPKGNEKLEKFTEKLKDAITRSVSGGVEVFVDPDGGNPKEVIIASIFYCFPLRVNKDLPWLQDEYKKLINDPNPERAKELKALLHTESDGSELPDLFIAKTPPRGDLIKIYMPYMLIAHAMGHIRYDDVMDGSGKKAYGVLEDDGIVEVLSPIANSFITIPDSEKFTLHFCEQIQLFVDNGLTDKWLHITEREKLSGKVKDVLKETILPECGNNAGSNNFLKYRDYGLKALEIIKQA